MKSGASSLRPVGVAALCWLLATVWPGEAEVQQAGTERPLRPDSTLHVASVFADHMVLQRDQPLPVWGQATPGARVEVGFAGQKATGWADSAGGWRVTLDSLAASAEPADLVIRAAGTGGQIDEVHFNDVLVGEVWIAAGQSNMEWPLQKEAFAEEALAGASIPELRLLNLDFATKYVFGTPFTPAQLSRLEPGQFFSGRWLRCDAESAKPFSAIGFYFGRDLKKELGVPVGIIHLAVGGSPTEAWIRRGALEQDPALRALVRGNWLTNESLGPWCRERGHQNLDGRLQGGIQVFGDDMGPNHAFKPGFLWDSGLEPLRPFGIRGVLWYQGESNSLEEWRVRQHEALFPLLVDDWRSQWHHSFAFLFCQLSSIGTAKGYQAHFWPEFRDSQRRMLGQIKNAALVVTADLGHPTDVHPRNKRDVGHRLALAALGTLYGRANETSGPLFKSAILQAGEVVVSFDHAGNLGTNDHRPPRGFELAGSDRQFRPAAARIERDQTILRSTGIEVPAFVRYGWQPFPDPPLNLVNGAGLPASTFAGQVLVR